MNIGVIGAGLFGSIVADTLAADGHRVEVVDARMPGAASVAAACLMKPSWLHSAFGLGGMTQAFDHLDKLYPLETLQFALPPTRGLVSVQWVDPQRILRPDRKVIEARVRMIVRQRGTHRWVLGTTVHGYNGPLLECDKVVVAAGVWCNDIQVRPEPAYEPEALHVEGLVARAGAAFLWPEESVLQPFIRPWAPYRQIVAFNRGDGLWVGDGSAIKEGNWTREAEARSMERCTRAVWPAEGTEPVLGPRVLTGLRPYVPGAKPCVLAEPHPGLWVVTGGAKNGTAAAGWAARKLSEALS